MENIVAQTEEFLKKYVTFAEDYYALPTALWTIATHTWPTFDEFPYLVITAYTKQAGKTTLMDLLCGIVSNGETFSADSVAAMFHALELNKPVMFLDEAEKLRAENHPAREFLNKGYQKGQQITRWIGDEVKKYDCYSPKCFVQIGDVYDTLKSRSIPILMRRRSPIEAAKAIRVRREMREAEQNEMREKIHSAVVEHENDIKEDYMQAIPLPFLNERDEQLFQALFSIARVFCPERVQELTQIAVDIGMEKRAPARKSTGAEWEAEEKKADDDEAKIVLLRDMLKLAEGKEAISTADLVEQLKAIPVAQWRKFRGRGLTSIDLGNLLDSLNIHPQVIRVKGTTGTQGKQQPKSTFRGYRTKDLKAAAILAGLVEE